MYAALKLLNGGLLDREILVTCTEDESETILGAAEIFA